MSNSYVLGTRGSLLAITQSQWVADQIPNAHIELQIVKTEGDNLSLSLASPTQPGAFVNALRHELIAGTVDFIVHSFKDLPSDPHPGTTLAAVTKREDPRDVLISYNNIKLSELEDFHIVGTSSPRRQAVISSMNPRVQVKPIRGNVDSRIQKVRNGEFAAAVLAAAGLSRIGRSEEISQYFNLEEFIPAPAQGALVVECREGDLELIELLRQVEDPHTRIATTAERAVLQGLNAGCELALGAFASIKGIELTLAAELGGIDGRSAHKIIDSIQIHSLHDLQSALELGLRVASQLKI